jgi:methionyl-tRNA formyltransferase
MRVVYFANNRVGWQIGRWLKEQGDKIAGLVLHPPERRRYGKEILESAALAPDRVFDGSRLHEPAVVAALSALQPEAGVSVLFGHRIPSEVLALFPAGCLNLHPAYLPYNRGAYPNVWSIVDGTPAGVTIHFVDEGIDTGDVVAQRRVEVEPTDTGETLYRRLEEASLELFRDAWPLIRSGRAPRTPQKRDAGTFHRVRDVARIDEIDLDASYNARSLLDVLRARTFGSFPGAYFRDGQRKIYMTVHLRESEEGGDGPDGGSPHGA